MAQLGKAVGILMRYDREVDAMYEDLHAFHAPSECYVDVERGLMKRFRLYRSAWLRVGMRPTPPVATRTAKGPESSRTRKRPPSLVVAGED